MKSNYNHQLNVLIKKKYGAIVKNMSGRTIFALNFIKTLS